MLKDIIHFLAAGMTPGELWRISSYEAHCIMMAIERLAPYYNEEDMDFLIWQRTIAVEAQKFNLRNVQEISTHTEIIPADQDRIFLEVLLKAERAHLEEYPPNTPCYDCGGTVYDHENTLREWLEREIELPKRFIVSRRKFEELSFEERLQRVRILARKDAERIVEKEIERLKIKLAAGDILPRAHEATLDDARKQLWTIFEEYIID